MATKHILVVEDDPSMQNLYSSIFRRHRDEFVMWLGRTGERGLEVLRERPVDLVVLDWKLPTLSGLDLLNHVRANPTMRDILIFMVTGEGDPEQKVLALQSEADDYIVKPMIVEEFLARLRGLLRRRESAPNERRELVLDDLKLDLGAREVTIRGRRVHLRRKPFEILALLVRHPDIIHSPAGIAEAVWGHETNSLAFHISDLRKMLGSPWGDRIDTHRDEGYMLNTRFPIPR